MGKEEIEGPRDQGIKSGKGPRRKGKTNCGAPILLMAENRRLTAQEHPDRSAEHRPSFPP